jgi:hypothetical protein
MAEQNVGTSACSSILEHSSSGELGQPLERNCGRLHIVVRGGLQGSAYQSVCSAAAGDHLQLGPPIHRLRHDPDHSCSS